MPAIPKRVADRLASGVKRFQPILTAAKTRDVNESDTAIVVTDVLSEVFGYDKYTEITSEFAIRGTCCDLAVKLEGTIELLLEVKAIGLELKDNHVKQAVDYAANQGVDWVVLSNGVNWRVYKVSFGKPIDQELVAEFDFLALNPKSEADLEVMFLITKEGWGKAILEDFHNQRQALSRFTLAATVLSAPILSSVRRELRKLSPDVKVDLEEIHKVLENEVLKREVLEGDKADEARRKLQRLQYRVSKAQEEAPAAQASIAAPELPASSPLTVPSLPTIVAETRSTA